MRRGGLIAVAVLALAFLAIRGFVAWQDTNPSVATTSGSNAGTTYDARTVEAGAVTVKLEPQRIDVSGAAIKLTFDTHSVDLGFDPTRIAHLTVAGQAWTATSWKGDGPGGHHRSGTIEFANGGPATGTAELLLDGLPGPVSASWTVTGS